MTRVLTVGETMALLDPTTDGPLSVGTKLTLRFAGAESNVAIALARLGISVSWASRLGADRFGLIIRDALAGEGVDTSLVQLDPHARTGVFFKWREQGASSVVYYRSGSAACNLSAIDIPDSALDGVELVHLTGITLALGEGPRALVADLAGRAHARGAIVIFDPNYRPALWASAAQAAAAQRQVLPFVDWYLCGLDEGRELFEVEGPTQLLEAIEGAAGRGVVRIGARGALLRAGRGLVEIPPVAVSAVSDEIGAGDAFAAGVAYGLLQGWAAESCVRAGNLLAAAALRGTGDWETLPRLADLEEDLLGLASAGSDRTPSI